MAVGRDFKGKKNQVGVQPKPANLTLRLARMGDTGPLHFHRKFSVTYLLRTFSHFEVLFALKASCMPSPL